MEVSPKERTFSEFCFAFLKSILNFKDFQEKDDSHSSCISRNTGSEKHG